MKEKKQWLIVGVVLSANGIRGKLNIKSFSDFNERFTKPGKRWLQKENENPIEFQLVDGFQKPGKEIFIVKLKEINTRNEAERLRKYKFVVKADDIPKLQDGEFHMNQLLGLKVKLLIDNRYKEIGEVCDFMNEKNNLLIIKIFKNNKEVLIPFVKEIIPIIDHQKKFLILKPPKGLLELQ